ncbi:facilitated trehalose transporter Tret1-2 homolog isoform X3 [Cylas formicarius]|uniref:facilitated trehalose transporter Tret1-2 homolog isoform X3 n=1 Tax=Cylas formicarius TaxID=197179 RepID=UPI0029588B36|nr:facilitated trehalose transporter Tret1-2 homolog isoform X3 [Cylas formicarius]
MDIRKNKFTYFAGISANLLTYGSGLGYGWASPALSKLSGHVDPENNPLSSPTTVTQESWIASLLSLGAMCSPFLTAFLSEKIGRKKTLLVFVLPTIISHLILIFAKRVVDFYVARFLIGLSTGCAITIVPLYSAEISQKHNRGAIGALVIVMLASGHFTASVVAPYVTIRTFSALALIPSGLFLIVFGIFVPESPYFYILMDDKRGAKLSLEKLRGTENVGEELGEIVKSVEELKSSERDNLRELFTSSYCLRCLFWSVALIFFQQLTGLIYIVNYTQKIFESAHTPISEEIAVMLVTLVQITSILVSTQILDRVPRRKLALLSLTSILVITTTMGTYFYMQKHHFNLLHFTWLPVLCLMVFILSFNMGICPISYIFPGEIFQPNVKSLGVNLVMCVGLFWEFAVASFLPALSNRFGFDVPFWVFTGATCFGIAFVGFSMPETGGKSFLEINESLRYKE